MHIRAGSIISYGRMPKEAYAMRNDSRDDDRRRHADDLSSTRRDDLTPGGTGGVGMGGASLGDVGGRYDSRSASGDRMERDVTSRLVHLDDVDEFKVADGDPDIRGWDVRTADGRKVGKVEDLIVDTGLMKVRYIEAKLDRAVTHTDDDRYVLIPIGTARLDDDEDDVFLATNVVDARQLPAYDRKQLTRDYEVSLRGQFAAGSADAVPGTADDDFYRGELYDDTRFFGTRRRGRESSNYISPTDDRTRRDEY
jgi:photosynthetic reaction center H subunit